MSSERQRERLRLVNQQLMKKMTAIGILGEIERVGEYAMAFVDSEDPIRGLRIHWGVIKQKVGEGSLYFERVPEGFDFPIVCFHDWSNCEGYLVNSPYGVLPNAIVGADNKLYHLGGYYLFDSKGNAVKFESVICLSEAGETLEATFGKVGLKRELVKKVDFVPIENDSRFVDLQPGDYEKIGTFLNRVESGELMVSDE